MRPEKNIVRGPVCVGEGGLPGPARPTWKNVLFGFKDFLCPKRTWEVITPGMFSFPSEKEHLSLPLVSSRSITLSETAESTVPEALRSSKVPAWSATAILRQCH